MRESTRDNLLFALTWTVIVAVASVQIFALYQLGLLGPVVAVLVIVSGAVAIWEQHQEQHVRRRERSR